MRQLCYLKLGCLSAPPSHCTHCVLDASFELECVFSAHCPLTRLWAGVALSSKSLKTVCSIASDAVEKCCHVCCSLHVKLLTCTCTIFFLTFIFSKLRASLDLLLLDNSFCRRLSGSAALPHSLVLLFIYVFFSFSLCSAGFFLCFCTNISPCLKTLWEFPQMWHKCPIRHSEHTV